MFTKYPPLVPFLGHLSPMDASPSYSLKTHFNIILPYTQKFWHAVPFPQVSPLEPCMSLSSSPVRATRPAHHSSWFDQPSNNFVSSTDHVVFPPSPVTSSLLDPNIFLNTPFRNTLSVFLPQYERDQVSHPYKTTGGLKRDPKSHFVWIHRAYFLCDLWPTFLITS